MRTGAEERTVMEAILDKYCRNCSLITLREAEQGARIDYAYHVKLRRGQSEEGLMSELRGLASIDGVHILMQEATVDL